MGAEGERELMRGVCVGRKPGCPRPSGRAVHIAVPPLSDSAWELGAGPSPMEGKTQVLTYLPLGFLFFFLSGSCVWRFWKRDGFVLVHNENRFEKQPLPPNFFFFLLNCEIKFLFCGQPFTSHLRDRNLQQKDWWSWTWQNLIVHSFSISQQVLLYNRWRLFGLVACWGILFHLSPSGMLWKHGSDLLSTVHFSHSISIFPAWCLLTHWRTDQIRNSLRVPTPFHWWLGVRACVKPRDSQLCSTAYAGSDQRRGTDFIACTVLGRWDKQRSVLTSGLQLLPQ